MRRPPLPRRRPALVLVASLAVLAAPSLAAPSVASADPGTGQGFGPNHGLFAPGNLLVATSIWTTDADITPGVTQLPPNCATANPADVTCATAVAPGTYPITFNNVGPDANFGVTQPIVLDQLDPFDGRLLNSVTVPDNPAGGDYQTTSFSSKSELALNQSTDDRYVTWVGYVAPPGQLDRSNTNTPGGIDPTVADSAPATYRAVGQVDADGHFSFTETNAFSGDNGRAAVLDPEDGPRGTIFATGNAGNGANPEPAAVVLGTGAQIMTPADEPEAAQDPGPPIPYANFSITQLGDAADKAGKDNNYRGITVYDGNVYFAKGSGSNGVDTVYFVDPNGTSDSSGGVGLPAARGTLPDVSDFTAPTYSTSDATLGLTAKSPGLTPTNTDILKGFPTALADGATDASLYPFDIWFANPTTMYVADEGSGDNAFDSTTGTYSAAAASTTAGVEKWTLNRATGTWQLDYTLQNGLDLGQPYHVAPGPRGQQYPTGLNDTDGGTGLPWAPATDGVRHLTGRVNPNGTVTLYASTSTVSGGGDQGADPNALLTITDRVSATTSSQAAHEQFQPLLAPRWGQVVRGVSFTPGTPASNGNDTSPQFPPGLPPGIPPGRD